MRLIQSRTRPGKSRVLYLAAVVIVSVAMLAYARAAWRSGGSVTDLTFSNIASPEMADTPFDSHGACWGDVDRDGDQDLFVVNFPRGKGESELSRLWRNEGGGVFTDIGRSVGVASLAFGLFQACTFADLDNDGDLDLYLTSKSNKEVGKQSKLFRNDGGGMFTDVTAQAAVGMVELGAASADWADYDGDGDYDGFVGNRSGVGPNGFFEQTGPLTFSDVAMAKGLAGPIGSQLVFLGSWFDYDADGDVDLLLAIDFWGVELYRNDAGGFIRVTTAVLPPATDASPGAPPNNPMGVTWGDFDNDGCFDVFITGMNFHGQGGFDERVVTPDSPTQLYRSNCDGAFSNATKAVGLPVTGLVEWGASFIDFDNDGDLDLSVVAGNTVERLPAGLRREARSARRVATFVTSKLMRMIPARWVAWLYRYEVMIPASGALGRPAAMPNLLYQNQLVETGKASFVEMSAKVRVATFGASRGSAWADFDNDGDLDWFIPGRATPNRLFRNNGPVGNYLRVHLVGDPLRDAVGAWVRIKVGHPAATQVRHVHVLDGYLSQSQMDPHFGLGAAQVVEEIQVRWSGQTIWTAACSNVPANLVVTIVQGVGCNW